MIRTLAASVAMIAAAASVPSLTLHAQSTAQTNCSGFGNTVSCTTTTTPSVYERGAELGASIRAIRDARAERRQTKETQKINVYFYRVKSLISDDFYGDTLLARAVARSDTTAAIGLVRDRITMDRQLSAMLDTLNAMQLKAGVEGVPHQALHELGERLQADIGLGALADSIERVRAQPHP